MPIRPAVASDWPDLVALDTTAPHDAQRAIQIERWIAAGHCHVLEQNGQSQASAVLTQHFFDRPFIEMIMVSAAFRRQGHAGAMIAHLIGLAGGAEIWTSTNRSNAAMQRILVRHGFVQRGLIDLDEGDPELILAAPRHWKL
jgi:ribosomal protein S18 acetylase RimI-like enzyme